MTNFICIETKFPRPSHVVAKISLKFRTRITSKFEIGKSNSELIFYTKNTEEHTLWFIKSLLIRACFMAKYYVKSLYYQGHVVLYTFRYELHKPSWNFVRLTSQIWRLSTFCGEQNDKKDCTIRVRALYHALFWRQLIVIKLPNIGIKPQVIKCTA